MRLSKQGPAGSTPPPACANERFSESRETRRNLARRLLLHGGWQAASGISWSLVRLDSAIVLSATLLSGRAWRSRSRALARRPPRRGSPRRAARRIARREARAARRRARWATSSVRARAALAACFALLSHPPLTPAPRPPPPTPPHPHHLPLSFPHRRWWRWLIAADMHRLRLHLPGALQGGERPKCALERRRRRFRRAAHSWR